MGEGDGTVSLLSLGAMCVEGWKKKRWNPAGIKVVTNEVCVIRISFEVYLLNLNYPFLACSPASPDNASRWR